MNNRMINQIDDKRDAKIFNLAFLRCPNGIAALGFGFSLVNRDNMKSVLSWEFFFRM